MALVGTGLTVAGGATKAFGEMASGDAQQKQYQYRAGVAKLNKQIAEQNAEYALVAGERNQQRKGMETAFVLGKQLVAQSSSGFDVNSGSQVAVRDSTTEVGRMDQGVIREEASRKSQGYRHKAVAEEAEIGANLAAGENAKSASRIQAFSTILGTAGSVAGKWYQGGSSFGGGGGSGITLYNQNMQASGWYA